MESNSSRIPFQEALQTKLQNTASRSESSVKRRANIDWVSSLSRAGLAFRDRANQLLIITTRNDEQIFIQYPGKESARSDDKQRPWDFYPRIKRDDNFGADLDFQDIWEILFEGLSKLATSDKQWAAIIATIFYRMAFMNDHILDNQPAKPLVREVYYDVLGSESIAGEIRTELNPWYQYHPAQAIVNRISEIVPSWGQFSFEAFLQYNDLLAWNEDCKYSYRLQQSKPGEWQRDIGRVNTLLTHVSIIGYVLGEIRFSEICIKFARGKGVAPATREEVIRICGGYVTK
jgi:hypothetical protein